MKRPSKKIVLPLLLLLAGAGIAFVVVTAKPEVERTTPETPAPLVEVLEVQPEDVDLDVYSQGTVTPHTESTLVAQVAGRIVGVSPDFAPGGFFRQGQVLIRIDPSDYRLAVSQAEAQVAQAELRLEREQAEARVAREEWDDLGTGEPSALALRGPQLAEARLYGLRETLILEVPDRWSDLFGRSLGDDTDTPDDTGDATTDHDHIC